MKEDTLNLLKECHSGIEMGVSAIDDVFPSVKSNEFKEILLDTKAKHLGIKDDAKDLLNEAGLSGTNPGSMAKFMSKMKTDFMLTFNETDSEAANLITDGCNMGVKKLSQYLNEYSAADEEVKKMVRRLIKIEEDLADDLKEYL